jgi:hypothetical protein
MTCHVMLDLETLGQSPRAPITQIGLAVFDPHSTQQNGEPPVLDTLGINVVPDLQKFDADWSTVQWWMKQSDEARAAFDKPAYCSEDAANCVEQFFHGLNVSHGVNNIRIWAKPPSFDMVILENFLRAHACPIPWHFRSGRCLRTLYDMAGIGKDDEYKSKTAHNALSDCLSQVLTAQKAFAILRNT